MNKNKKGLISWGTGLVIAIVLFMAGTLGFVFFSTTLDFDLVTQNHYEEAVDYQDVINRMEQSDQLSSPVRFRYDKSSQQLGITFPDELDGKTKQGILKLYRPGNASLDQQQQLKDIANNKLAIQELDLAKGKWKAQLEWSAGDTQYYSEATLFVE